MKRLLTLLLAGLLLAGCTNSRVTPTAPPDAAQTTTAQTATGNASEATAQATEPPAAGTEWDAALAEQTGGAVRAFPLDGQGYLGMLAMGNDLLLFSGSAEGTALTRISAETGTAVARTVLPGSTFPAMSTAGSEKVACYFGESRTVLFLDGALQKTSSAVLPQEMLGAPAVAPDFGTVYFCTSAEVRALDMQSGIARLLRREQSAAFTTVEACVFDGAMLQCSMVGEDGAYSHAFLSTETGELLGEDACLTALETDGQQYFLVREESGERELLVGERDGALHVLTPLLNTENADGALALSGVMTVRYADAAALRFYSLTTGRLAAETVLPAGMYPSDYLATASGIWFLASGGDGKTCLCRWQPDQSACDGAVCIGKRYTENDPDLAGLDACRAEMQELGARYGVEICLREDVPSPGGYTLTPAYRVGTVQRGLAALEKALSRFPEGFFTEICEGTGSGVLHIGLVHRISGGLVGLQYWSDGEAWLALTGLDDAEQTFYHELCHVLDSYIIVRAQAYDDWDALNPADFSYDYSYDLYAGHAGSPYLFGEDRAFVDAYSMTFPKEDRARVFEYAMMPQQEALFAAETMQQKLQTICTAIREAFDWEDVPEQFPWEQYLKDEE